MRKYAVYIFFLSLVSLGASAQDAMDVYHTAASDRLTIATAKERLELVVSQGMVIAICVTIVLLLVASIILYRQNKRIRNLVREQRNYNERLRNERNQLRAISKELEAARDAAEKGDKLKSDILDIITHEVKEPLNTVLEYTRLIIDCMPDEQSRFLDRFAHTAEENGRLVIRLLNDMLDASGLEHGQFSINRMPFNLNTLCRLAIDTVFEGGHPSSEKVVFRYHPDPSAPKEVLIDQYRVGQVLMNLLNNADKFTDEGFIELGYRYDAEHGRVVFHVADSGCGIPEAAREKVFERFYQVDTHARGCGLGLYIARLVADLVKGTVDIERTGSDGSRFIFSIPVK